MPCRALPSANPATTGFLGAPDQIEAQCVAPERLKKAKWPWNGLQVVTMFCGDANGILHSHRGDLAEAVPRAGNAPCTDWLANVGGIGQGELADLFLCYPPERETQQRFPDNASGFRARMDLVAPPHKVDYPMTGAAIVATFSLFSPDGWDKFGANCEAPDGRTKQTAAVTTAG